MYLPQAILWVELNFFQIRNLSERTGVCAFVFFTRTHIHDSAIPTWADSDDATAFVSEVLDLEPMDLLAKFEQWACARAKSVYIILQVSRRLLTMTTS
jgi:hypothetical protein